MARFETIPSDVEDVGRHVFDACFRVHRELGPGLLGTTYEACLEADLQDRGLEVERQVALPVIYRGRRMDAGYRLDLLVEKKVIVEVKAIETVLPVHEAQLLTYLKLSRLRLGYQVNFNLPLVKDGIHRLVL